MSNVKLKYYAFIEGGKVVFEIRADDGSPENYTSVPISELIDEFIDYRTHADYAEIVDDAYVDETYALIDSLQDAIDTLSECVDVEGEEF